MKYENQDGGITSPATVTQTNFIYVYDLYTALVGWEYNNMNIINKFIQFSFSCLLSISHSVL